MSAVIIACPHCGKELKLPDRSKLGRKGKCPGCAKSFVLAEPPEEEVELELASAVPPIGTSARWVPDDSPAPRGVVTAAAREPMSVSVGPVIQASSDDGTVERLKRSRQQASRRRNYAILGGAVMAACVAGLVYFLNSNSTDPANTAVTQPGTGQTAIGTTPIGSVNGTPGGVPVIAGQPGTPVGVASQPDGVMPSVFPGNSPGTVIIPFQELLPSRLKANEEILKAILPTAPKPIETQMVPNGMNLIIHLRPAQLWSDDPLWTEIRYSLTEDVTNWIAAKLKEICRREPQQIEECLICVRLGATGTAPEISTVVHFVEDAKLSDLIEEFRGAPYDGAGRHRINLRDGLTFVVKDTKTIAIAPQSDVMTMSESVDQANQDVPDAIYELLKSTDPNRVFTVAFIMDDVKRHEDWLFTAETKGVFRQVLDWFGDDVEAVCWSVGVNQDAAFSDLRLRTRAAASSTGLTKDLLARLEYLPQEMMNACRKMRPETQGFVDIISRFPAMLELFREATIPVKDQRDVRLVTYLPRKAAPNLALGTILAWSESLRTDFSATTAVATTVAGNNPDANLPATAAERLLIVMDAEFSNPFQDAIAYIAGETKLTFEIDGNALKDAGFTKNMPQKFSLGRVPAIDAMREIVKNNKPPTPDKRICFCVDEATKTVLVTTEKFAIEAKREFLKLVED